MLYAVIDIGSNSARLMLSDGKKTLFKEAIVTALSKNMGDEKVLKNEAIEATFSAVSFFINKAKNQKADYIYAFATACVRQASNKEYFISEFFNRFSFDLEVISGEEEALLGLYGAVSGDKGGVIDIGGASTEIIYKDKASVNYKKSIYLGCVNITDKFGQDYLLVKNYCDEVVLQFDKAPKGEYKVIGGTGTSIGAIVQDLPKYDSGRVNGYIIDIQALNNLIDKLYQLSIEERKNIKCLQVGREEVIASGAVILQRIMRLLGLSSVTVSESDNLEGYLIRKLKNE